jgi:hypothetical protein
MFGLALALLVQAAWFRCKQPATLFWTAFAILLYQFFAVVPALRPRASMEWRDQAG